jgi:alkaline phosphatase
MSESLKNFIFAKKAPMKNKFLLLPCLLFFVFILNNKSIGQNQTFNKKIKNVIIMIPDGTSASILSLSRWYQWYLNNNITNLTIDSLLCGFVKTYSSDAPIGDSAPTSSCYSTGQESQTGFIATYPLKTANDLVKIDAAKAYQPLMTVLEAAKLSGKSTGLVFTCEFPHATPADFSAHSYSRRDYNALSKQMVYNNIDVVFGGGDTILKKAERNYLGKNGWDTAFSDINSFRRLNGLKAWALFSPNDMPYDIDRDTSKEPSLAEMTSKSIALLSKNIEQGFFLMVEGSKVDWAAHGNDPIGIITEFLAFDKALKVALDFAKLNGETVIIICPDHGNSGISFGNKNSNYGYDKLTAKQIFEPLTKYQLTSEGLSNKIISAIADNQKTLKVDLRNIYFPLIKIFWGIDSLGVNEFEAIDKSLASKNYYGLSDALAKLITARNYIGFTTTGHTGEDVFLGIYSPQYYSHPTGLQQGRDINAYLCKALGIESLSDSTEKYFAPHKKVFINCSDTIIKKNGEYILQISKGKNTIEIPANKNIVYVNKKALVLNTVVVYVDKNKTFYLPESLGKLIE